METPRTPWVAAVLAFALGGPGCFYLGWRRGVKATLGWMLAAPLLVLGAIRFNQLGNPEPAIVFLCLLQGALAWMAYRSCKRTNSESAKEAKNPESNPRQRAQAKCIKEKKDTGAQMIVLSAITLFGGVMTYWNTSPPMEEFGHFAHGFALVLAVMSAWGVATGIGLKRAWRWAWISMLVFGAVLSLIGTLGTVPVLLMPGAGVGGWNLIAMRAIGVLLFLTPAAIGVRWFTFFMSGNVKAYFGVSRPAPHSPA